MSAETLQTLGVVFILLGGAGTLVGIIMAVIHGIQKELDMQSKINELECEIMHLKNARVPERWSLRK